MSNGNINVTFKYIASTLGIIGLLLTLFGLVWSASSRASDIETTTGRVDVIEPKVQELSDHKISSELELTHIKEKVDAIDGKLTEINTTQTQIFNAINRLAPKPE